MEQQNYVEVQEEIVTPDTTYMCGACYEWFPYIEDFNAHTCSADTGENSGTQEVVYQEEYKVAQEEGDVEKDVANILGEMKYTIPSRTSFQTVNTEHVIQEGEENNQSYIVHYEQDGIASCVPHKEETTIEVHADPEEEGVEIPSSCLYPYENPAYLNRLMKDNTVGKRLRHDAPYTHRLGPWDNTSTTLLIKYLAKVPAAYFIASDSVKRTEAWELIRTLLSEADYHFTVLQIRMRWRELCKKYRNVVNYNDLHGTKRTCQFFNELNELFGKWNRHATEILIKELAYKDLKQNGGLRMRYNTWDKIRKVLLAHGYNYTAHQVHGRWNALVTLYQRMVDRNSNPDTEPFDVAYKELIEPIFPYVGRPSQGKGLRESKDKWTLSAERALLQAYTDNIENFRKNASKNNRDVWQQIIESLQKECGYSTTVEKARTRFYELAKYYGTMLRYNSQPGALHRESKHNEILATIYNRYNQWPHDGSIIKLDNLNARRMRQLNAQLRWTEDESRAALQLYPQVLTDHLQAAEQQPLEELWVQMAKMLIHVKGISKRPYEIEEHIVLLRRGFKSDNPFPFRAEMEELEETEHSLCFSPNESPSTDAVQMVPYWSHSAAQTLLNYVIHYRQEGVKTLNDNMYEVISIDLESHGYSYTGKECRQYYLLLRKIFKNRLQAGEENKDSSFLYWDRMVELKTVSQFDFEDTEDIRLKILEAASSKLERIMGGDDITRQQNMERNLCQLKIYLMNFCDVHPPPPIKVIANTLLSFMKNDEVVSSIDTHTYFMKLRNMLLPHVDILTVIAERGALRNLEKLQMEGKKRQLSRGQKLKSQTIQWNDENIQTMLSTVKEWVHTCHDEDEICKTLSHGQPLWEEVAYKLSRRNKKCPDLCKQYYNELCDKYIKDEVESAAAAAASGDEANSPTIKEELSISPLNKSTLKCILSPILSHDAEWDPRDVWWAAEAEGWSREETLELLFTVRELLNDEDAVDWDQVKLMMLAGGYDRTAERYQSKFIDLYNGYKRAFTINKSSQVRDRRRPPFYFKLHTLFGFKECIQRCFSGKWKSEGEYPDEDEVCEVLLAGLKERKNLVCHMVPRIPMLKMLVTYLQEQYDDTVTFYPNQVWHLLIQLHKAQTEVCATEENGPFGKNLDGLWQNHSNPLVAYGFQAIPTSGWQWVKNWSNEEMSILIDDVVKQCVGDSPKEKDAPKIPNIFLYQLGYMLSTFRHGGYQTFANQLNLLHMLRGARSMGLMLNNPILLKVQENYRTIEQSKAVLKRSTNSRSSESNLPYIDDLSELSEDSDEKDIFSDSELENDSEMSDSDEENLQVTILSDPQVLRKSKTEAPEEQKQFLGDASASKSDEKVTTVEKSKNIQNNNEVKYFFQVKTSGIKSPKVSQEGNLNIQVVASPDNEKKEIHAQSVVSGNTDIQIYTNSNIEKVENLDETSATKSGTGLSKRTGKKQIVFSPVKKGKIYTGSISSIKNGNTSEGTFSPLGTEHSSEVKVSAISKRKTTDFVPNQAKKLRFESEKDGTSVQDTVKTSTLSQDAKNATASAVLDDDNSKEESLTVSKSKLTSQKGSEQNPNITKDEKENDGSKKGEMHVDERKAALMKLSNQYYQRRIQEKDRLLSAFNAIQDSHHEQASAILVMFDNLQNLL
ncbi:hypothetical protein SK128_015393 [Halocaridina rubra]|uniref:Myb/SANT-like DNA-binding domain-containing protein n=1 Tax=Halocaridina rubra TaxID=373956 RepID=A0AAN8X632_HALRR